MSGVWHRPRGTERKEVLDVLELGVLPRESNADVQELERWEHAIARIPQPVTLEEARALMGAFGPDDCFGLAWSLLRTIETCGACVVAEQPDESDEWRCRVWRRWMHQFE